MFREAYRLIHEISQSKKHQLVVDATVTSFATYLALKKAFGWSLTSALAYIFNAEIIQWIVISLAILCFYSAIAKVFYMITTAFPASRVKGTEVEDLAHCCLSINNEIKTHIERIVEEPQAVAQTFRLNHNFQVNVAIAADSLARHMLSTLTGAESRDIFVSIYQVPSFMDLDEKRVELEYICHYPQKRDVIVNKRIGLTANAFRSYECVKCIDSPDHTWVRSDCSDYFKSRTRRLKNIKHYIGMKLLCGEILLGFVNIEFYNTTFFGTDDEMRTYLEENILTFKYLIEYQFLKSAFFHYLTPHLQ